MLRWLVGCLVMLGTAEAGAGRPPSLTVLLDPGHGGTNAGAVGHDSGLLEKRFTLELSRRLAARLARELPGARIQLTRQRDEYLTLAERGRRAEAARADLFISLHANASETRSRFGYETFILSREASDREAARLALGQNGKASGGPAGALGTILGNLRQSAAHAGSLILARAVQRRLAEVRGAARDRGVRQAPFDVLMGLRIPAVLIEVGYIDHPVEGPELATATVQEQIAGAVAAAVRDFWLARDARSAVDSSP